MAIFSASNIVCKALSPPPPTPTRQTPPFHHPHLSLLLSFQNSQKMGSSRSTCCRVHPLIPARFNHVGRHRPPRPLAAEKTELTTQRTSRITKAHLSTARARLCSAPSHHTRQQQRTIIKCILFFCPSPASDKNPTLRCRAIRHGA